MRRPKIILLKPCNNSLCQERWVMGSCVWTILGLRRLALFLPFADLHVNCPVDWLPICRFVWPRVDCKTVRIFAYSSTREQSNKRCGTRLKTESETGEIRFFSLARFARIRVLRHALPISLLILRKKPTVLQSRLRAVPLLHLPNFVSRSPTARGKFEKEYGGQSDAQIGQS